MINEHDFEYLDVLSDVLEDGEPRPDRTGTGTLGLFGTRMVFDLSQSFPLLTTKRIHWKSVAHELIWLIRGGTNVKYLNDNGVSIWNEWADANGELGPVYGAQWRHWKGAISDIIVDETILGPEVTLEHHYIDQLANVIDALRTDPFSRRHVVSAWNVADLPDMALAPCHALFQFWVSASNNSLHCQLYQRSCDIFLGVPFNLASYSLLTCILADKLGFERGSLTWVGGDTHLYLNHVAQASEQLQRTGAPPPTLAKLQPGDPLAVTFEEIQLLGYKPNPAIPAPVSV